MNKKNIVFTGLLALIISPVVSYAALDELKALVEDIGALVNLLFPIVMGLAVVFFFWGVGQFILNDAGNDKTREEGKKKMLWGIIGLFVIFSIMGILRWISSTVEIPLNTNGLPRAIQGGSGSSGVDEDSECGPGLIPCN